MSGQILHRYIYIICEMVAQPPRPDGVVESYPSFRHQFIFAKDDEDAYRVGQAELEQPKGNGINDYVVRVR